MSLQFDELSLCCPICKGDVARDLRSYRCEACNRQYPVVLGIPDFRVFPDPWIGLEADRMKGTFLDANARDLSFEDFVRFYWAITPDVPPESVERFVRHVILLSDKWEEGLPNLEAELPRRPTAILELGCGTGGFAAVAAGRGYRVVGVDLAFRWLVVAQKRLREVGQDVPLVCACAEYLPFRDDQFDLVVGEALVEHLRDQEAGLRECRRVGVPGGTLYLRTTNRYSLAPEPHVGVWGVGYLPRRWMEPYVKWVKGVEYPFLRLVSKGELRRLLRRAGFTRTRYSLPRLTRAETSALSTLARVAVRLYGVLRRARPAEAVLTHVFPILEAKSSVPGPEPPHTARQVAARR